MEELGNGTFCQKRLKKMPEKMITQYQRRIFDKEKKGKCCEFEILSNSRS